ncbi:MAG TPA: hypothetical protein VHT24_00840 [Pseudacidobacterium sp.]|nr:hypothetical protein [Pseudacidobacterium sp.]
MPEIIAQKPLESEDGTVEIEQKDVAEPEPEKRRVRFSQKIGKLKPLLPILTGGLRLIDHGAAQMVAQLLNLANPGGASAAADNEIQHGIAEIEASHRDLRLSVQDHSVELKRIEEQILLMRETVERNASEHTKLVEDVNSLGNLVRMVGIGLAILLILLLVLTGLLLIRK